MRTQVLKLRIHDSNPRSFLFNYDSMKEQPFKKNDSAFCKTDLELKMGGYSVVIVMQCCRIVCGHHPFSYLLQNPGGIPACM